MFVGGGTVVSGLVILPVVRAKPKISLSLKKRRGVQGGAAKN